MAKKETEEFKLIKGILIGLFLIWGLIISPLVTLLGFVVYILYKIYMVNQK